MPSATVTSKGQTTIPKMIREHLNLQPGDRINFLVEDGRVVLRAKNRSLMDVAGMLRRPGRKALTTDDMNEAIATAVLEKDARSRQ